MKILLVRHGQTILNQLDKVQGWSDSPLTELGIQQANKVKEILSNITISKAYCSSSERAIDTAEMILEERNVDLVIDRRLKEMNYGTFEASPNYIKAQYDQNKKGHDYVEVGGENVTLLLQRVGQCFNEIINSATMDDTVLIVSHGGTIYHIINDLVMKNTDEDFHKEYISKNCEVKVVEYNNGSFKLEESLCV